MEGIKATLGPARRAQNVHPAGKMHQYIGVI